jgi:hypothetical protein
MKRFQQLLQLQPIAEQAFIKSLKDPNRPALSEAQSSQIEEHMNEYSK